MEDTNIGLNTDHKDALMTGKQAFSQELLAPDTEVHGNQRQKAKTEGGTAIKQKVDYTSIDPKITRQMWQNMSQNSPATTHHVQTYAAKKTGIEIGLQTSPLLKPPVNSQSEPPFQAPYHTQDTSLSKISSQLQSLSLTQESQQGNAVNRETVQINILDSLRLSNPDPRFTFVQGQKPQMRKTNSQAFRETFQVKQEQARQFQTSITIGEEGSSQERPDSVSISLLDSVIQKEHRESSLTQALSKIVRDNNDLVDKQEQHVLPSKFLVFSDTHHHHHGQDAMDTNKTLGYVFTEIMAGSVNITPAGYHKFCGDANIESRLKAYVQRHGQSLDDFHVSRRYLPTTLIFTVAHILSLYIPEDIRKLQMCQFVALIQLQKKE